MWTRVRAKQAGYEVGDTKCELCGIPEGIIHGRIWKCQHPLVKKARDDAVSATIIRAALKAGPDSALYNRGFFAHPREDYPEAAKDPVANFTYRGTEATAENLEFQGRVFIDGSCDQHMIGDLKRAGWGAVATEDNVRS